MQIHFLTINIWNGGILFGPLLRYLKETNADIVNMQEVYNGYGPNGPAKDASVTPPAKRFHALEIFTKELNYPYVHFAPECLHKVKEGVFEHGTATFSKYPIVSSEVNFTFGTYGEIEDKPELYSKMPHNLQHNVIDAQGTKLNIFNTHGIWGEDGKDTPERIALGKTIAKHVEGFEHTILSGDFNMDPNIEATGYIEKHLKSIFKNELTSTFNMKRKDKPGYATAVADMIFASPDMKVINKSCDQVDVTDHLPLRATFEI